MKLITQKVVDLQSSRKSEISAEIYFFQKKIDLEPSTAKLNLVSSKKHGGTEFSARDMGGDPPHSPHI